MHSSHVLLLSRCGGDGALYEAMLCYRTCELRLVFEIEFIIVMQIGPDLTCVMLSSFFFLLFLIKFNNLDILIQHILTEAGGSERVLPARPPA